MNGICLIYEGDFQYITQYLDAVAVGRHRLVENEQAVLSIA